MRVVDVNELLAELEPRAERHELPMPRRLPGRLPPRTRAGDPRRAARGAALDPGARAGRAGRAGDLLRQRGYLQPRPAGAGGRAGRAEGGERRRHRRGGVREREPQPTDAGRGLARAPRLPGAGLDRSMPLRRSGRPPARRPSGGSSSTRRCAASAAERLLASARRWRQRRPGRRRRRWCRRPQHRHLQVRRGPDQAHAVRDEGRSGYVRRGRCHRCGRDAGASGRSRHCCGGLLLVNPRGDRLPPAPLSRPARRPARRPDARSRRGSGARARPAGRRDRRSPSSRSASR